MQSSCSLAGDIARCDDMHWFVASEYYKSQGGRQYINIVEAHCLFSLVTPCKPFNFTLETPPNDTVCCTVLPLSIQDFSISYDMMPLP